MKIFVLIITKIILIILISSNCFADDVIQGHYCYTYGDNESLKEAREIVRTLAIRNAIESYRVFITSASTVKNFQLTNDLVQMISSGYLKDIKVIKHTEDGRTICETIQANIPPKEVEYIIKKEVMESIKKTEDTGLGNNGVIKILKITPNYFYLGTLSSLDLTIKCLQEIKVSQSIRADFYDSAGDPIITRYGYVSSGEMGAFKQIRIDAGYEAKSWKILLKEFKPDTDASQQKTTPCLFPLFP